LLGECRCGAQAVDATVEFTPAVGDPGCEKAEHSFGNHESRILTACRLGASAQDFEPEIIVQRTNFDDEAAGKTRPHARIEFVQLKRCTISGNHNLFVAIDMRIEHVAEFLLDRRALEKFQIVDQQNIDLSEFFLEGHRVPCPERFYEPTHKELGRQIEDTGIRVLLADGPRNGVQQVGFT